MLSVVSQTALGESARVYNIEIDEHHTYHVGELGVWVHNANCCDVTQQNAVAPTASGYINKSKLAKEAIVIDAPAVVQPVMRTVQLYGDPSGEKTEFVVNVVLAKDPAITVLSGTKYGANNGLDHVVQFTDPADGLLKTMVIDSKQLAKNGTTSLDPQAAGGVMQLSEASLRTVMLRLGPNSEAARAIDLAMSSNTLVKAVAYIDKITGGLKIVPVKP